MTTTYQIHPAIGIARLGNSPTDFCITPETPGALPTACDEEGNALLSPDGESERKVDKLKDADGRIKRQAARFHVCVHDDENPAGRPLRTGDPVGGGGNFGTLVDIQWRVYLANKKASWYEFEQLEGEHGYSPGHPRRNASVVESSARQRLIIDPGSQAVDRTTKRTASFARGANPDYAQSFPPPGKPHTVNTLGDLLTDDVGRLLVLGGHGDSGSIKDGFDDPIITDYANNDGWFDDTSDGPVMARLKFYVEDIDRCRFIDVAAPAWVIVGYPAYVPEILDMVTMDDVVFDLGVRSFATRPELFGTPPFKASQRIDPTDTKALDFWRAQELRYNPGYFPWFYRDVWPILNRPYYFQYLTRVLYGSNFPHDQSERGTFFRERLAQVPKDGEDPTRKDRQYLFQVLRMPGEENEFRDFGRPDSRTHNVPLMPLLSGDNPISNVLPSKFLRLTDTQLFVLKQWADGRFINEKAEWGEGPPVGEETNGHSIDRGVLSNVLGGAFCPGGEVGWILRNPSIYSRPYRLKADPAFYEFGQTAANAYSNPGLEFAYYTDTELSQDSNFEQGLQPGDLTKYMALPWQADFNECSMQPIDITYEEWNKIYPDEPVNPQLQRAQRVWETLWWPAHRPMQVFKLTVEDEEASYPIVDWAKGIPQTSAGDLKMVTSWADLGFVVANPFYQGNPEKPPEPWEDPGSDPLFVAVEINTKKESNDE